MSASVSVCDLTKLYGSVVAVRGISFDVAAGEIFGLLGPNGAGKTTTLECILGLRRPDLGSILIAGIDAVAHPAEAKQLVGAQIQSATLQDKITPRQVLGLFASFYREPAKVDDLIGQFGLSAKADAPFDSLSSGQRQRLFLALAFVNDPRLVVLDEPTAGLDPRSRRELHDVINGMRTAGRTVLLSTHDLDEAHRLCDRIGILDEGRIIAVARPADLIAASGATPHIAVKTIKMLAASLVGSLPGVTSCQQQADGWLLGTTDVNRTIGALVRGVEAAGNGFLDLQIHRPTLEDVFLSLTGRAWSSPGEEEK
jgi:ABC-2 type transport system ATP-binding protein